MLNLKDNEMLSRKLPAIRFVLFSIFIVFLAGCSSLGTYNTATQKRELIFISTAEEAAMGKQIHSKLLSQYKFSQDENSLARVKRVGTKLVQVSDRQDYSYQFYVIEKDELNAFTTPGGNIYIFTGLLNNLKSDDQLASVLAHEIGHCSAKHTIKKYQAALGYNFIGTLVLNQLGAQSRQIVNLSSGVLMNLVFSAYGRNDEFQADKLGLKYMYLTGYDLKGMAEVFEFLDKESKGDSVPLLLKSHPHLKDRVAAVNQEIKIIEQQYN